MIPEDYIIFSLRSNAWVGASVPYTSDISKAQRFTLSDAVEACRLHRLQGKMVTFPVALEIIKEIVRD